MFRLIGFIVGVGLMLLAAIAWLDAPQAKNVSAQLHRELDQAIEQIAQQEPAVLTPTENTHTMPLPVEVQALVNEVSLVVDTPTLFDNMTASESWHIFWQPFKSRQSADGFAARLSKQTGIEIAVVADETGHYRVNFSYLDESDKLRILQLIEDKTGLKVSA